MKDQSCFKKWDSLTDTVAFKRSRSPQKKEVLFDLSWIDSTRDSAAIGFFLPKRLIKLAVLRNKIKRICHEQARIGSLPKKLVIRVKKKIDKNNIQNLIQSIRSTLKETLEVRKKKKNDEVL